MFTQPSHSSIYNNFFLLTFKLHGTRELRCKRHNLSLDLKGLKPVHFDRLNGKPVMENTKMCLSVFSSSKSVFLLLLLIATAEHQSKQRFLSAAGHGTLIMHQLWAHHASFGWSWSKRDCHECARSGRQTGRHWLILIITHLTEYSTSYDG